jgi:hypothetical protein
MNDVTIDSVPIFVRNTFASIRTEIYGSKVLGSIEISKNYST